MKNKLHVYSIAKSGIIAILCILIALLCWSARMSALGLPSELSDIPDANYVSDIRSLKDTGRLSEALALARYVCDSHDLPGKDEACTLRKQLEDELNSYWGKAKRAANGFVTGGGSTAEEMGGAIASDMVMYGDIRDILKQAYNKVMGNDTDPVIAALAGIGLATELVDAADWVPAVLKGFRRLGSLTDDFAEWLIRAIKKTVGTRKIDDALKQAYTDLRSLCGNAGFGRAPSIMKYVNDPVDLSAAARIAEKNPDTAYLMAHAGGNDGMRMMKELGATPKAMSLMSVAVKKGKAGLAWLQVNGKAREYSIMTRITARVLKNLRLQRPQKILADWAHRSDSFVTALLYISLLGSVGFALSSISIARRINMMWSTRKQNMFFDLTTKKIGTIG